MTPARLAQARRQPAQPGRQARPVPANGNRAGGTHQPVGQLVERLLRDLAARRAAAGDRAGGPVHGGEDAAGGAAAPLRFPTRERP